MCYSTSAKSSAKKLEGRFKAKMKEGVQLEPHYLLNGFAHPKTPVITTEEPTEINTFKWGLIPSFCRDMVTAKDMMTKTLNAKSETVFSLPSFKFSIPNKRCLILVDGFYEWQTIGKNKYPYFIHLKGGEPFAFGGIYNTWVDKDTGEIFNTYSIITTAANPFMSKIHNSKERMPLIIPKEKEAEWIDKDLKQNQIEQLMLPFDENLMEAWTISKLITNRKENPDKPEVQEKYEYPELGMFE
jgi:putative SOS response-associated peptidase YedK